MILSLLLGDVFSVPCQLCGELSHQQMAALASGTHQLLHVQQVGAGVGSTTNY